MPNPYFRFKQFVVWQQNTAMKVCTDSCLFGAWVANTLLKLKGISNIADIGTGTGLLALMTAQKTSSAIDAIEIDDEAAAQAAENFKQSPWAQRLTVIKQDVRNNTQQKKYGVVLSNPPFYENALKANDDKKNFAKHSNELTLQQLINAVNKLIEEQGSLFLLLPNYRTNECIDLAKDKGLFLQEVVNLKQTENHSYFRSMFWFGKKETTGKSTEIIIKQQKTYSPEFVHLLKDYYLTL